MFVRDCWYVAAWGSEITTTGLLERTILGESLVMWRKADGTAVIMGNRCPHRHAPLSLGRREGDAIRCMYHGLKLDEAGRCIEIPGQARINAKLCARRYPAVERGAWLWVWPGDPAKADPDLLPDTVSLAHPDWHYKPGGYLHYDSDYLLICDNLLDFSHLSYVHEATLGGSTGIAETAPRIEPLERGVRVSRHVRDIAPPPYIVSLRGRPFGGNVDRLLVYDFLVPGVLLLASRTKPTDTAEEDRTDEVLFHSCQALTPETARTTHYFFMQAHRFGTADPSISERLHASLCVAFAEDRRMIESQRRMIDAHPPAPMQWIDADQALGRFRALVRQLIENESRAGAA